MTAPDDSTPPSAPAADAVFEASPAAMTLLRLVDFDDLGSFTPVMSNAAACEQAGRDLKADLGRPWSETSPELADSEFAPLFLEVLQSGEPDTYELRYGDSKFQDNWWRGIVTPVDEHHVLVTFENVSRIKELEAAKAQLIAELARSNEALDSFAYIASHDLRAPLRDIENLSSWIVEDVAGDLPEASARHLAQLQGRVQRMDRLLTDLLRYSRAGRVEEAPRRCELAPLLRAAIALAGVPDTFEVTVPDARVTLHTPRSPLELVLRNLIANAVKHHDRGAGAISIQVRDGEERIAIAVQDDGPGIPEEHRERVFGMFQTLRPVDEVDGTGMGLALCRKLVRYYGGELTVESGFLPEGRGTRFRFSWPRETRGGEGA